MPLTAKGTEIMAALTKEYGAEKGKSVFYAGKNSGKFTGVDENCTAEEKLDEIACRADALGERLEAIVFEQPAQSIKDSFSADDLKKLNDVMTSGFPATSVNQPVGDAASPKDEGIAARKAGKPASENPYSSGSRDYIAWRSGWGVQPALAKSK